MLSEAVNGQTTHWPKEKKDR